MTLRQWQAECIEQACRKYAAGQSHFLCLATPGAGKTRMASTLARRLLEENQVDLIMCFAPSVIVTEDFRTELEVQIGERFDGMLGSLGRTVTYQGMLTLADKFWELLRRKRVFVVFDEIHHCAGLSQQTANAWGQQIIARVQGQATYTLALTGTPWRSDAIPIVLSRYCRTNGQIECDYQYGLSQAIKDGVCRTPQLTIIDNDQITVRRGNKFQNYTTFRELLSDPNCSYQKLLETEALIVYILEQANNTLTRLRAIVPESGGLIVAASVAHAHYIYDILTRKVGENAVIATYREDDPIMKIRHFKSSHDKWIISVGMISEGTNVPRLRVCCHLTRVKTELYFRQILGRILRAGGKEGEESYLYMPAEPNLVEYALRLADDIPTADPIKFQVMPPQRGGDTSYKLREKTIYTLTESQIAIGRQNAAPVTLPSESINQTSPSSTLQSYEAKLDFFGRFRRELLLISGLKAE